MNYRCKCPACLYYEDCQRKWDLMINDNSLNCQVRKKRSVDNFRKKRKKTKLSEKKPL